MYANMTEGEPSQEEIYDVVSVGKVEPLGDGSLQRNNPSETGLEQVVPDSLSCVIARGRIITLEDRVTGDSYGRFLIMEVGIFKKGAELSPCLRLRESGKKKGDIVVGLYDLMQKCMVNGTDVHHEKDVIPRVIDSLRSLRVAFLNQVSAIL